MKRSGSVDELPSGRWRVRVTVDGRRRTLGVFDDQATAERMLRAFRLEVDDGAIVAASALTLRAFGRDWLNRRELNGSRDRAKVRDIANERRLWRRHVEASSLADLAVQSIRTRDVDAFARWLRAREKVSAVRTRDGVVLRPQGKPIAVQTQRNVLRLVRQVLDEAVRAELVATNPAKLVRVGKGGRSADLEDDWLRAGEIEQLLTCAALPLRDRTAYAAAVGLALRLNDLKALRVEDVRLDDEVPGPHVRLWIAKTERYHRVPVLPWLEPWLKAHLETLPDGAQWLFPTRTGGRYGKYYDFRWAEKRERRGTGDDGKPRWKVTPSALELAGVERRIRFHDLRGTTATHLALGTWGRVWSLHEIQRMLAHADQRTTERYVRTAQDLLTDAACATRGGPGGPGAGDAAVTRGHADPEKASVPERIRTSDLRFRNSERDSAISGGYAACDRNVTAVARELLERLDQGDTPHDLRRRFAELVIAAGEDLARRGREAFAGPYAWRRAIELAGLVLGQGEADVADGEGAGGA